MCYHKSLTAKYEQLAEYYGVPYSDAVAENYQTRFHENGFDFHPGPVVTAGKPNDIQLFHWGLVPYWVKDEASAMRMRTSTLNCISEEMFDKPAFRDAAREGKRCLIPCTGFMEWKWMDEKGKTKIPHFVYLKEQPIFSIAGLYARWNNRDKNTYYYSYTVLTTAANAMMEEIHNSKKRMPVIIPHEYERDWLNPNLTDEDVMAMCQPIDANLMTARTISRLITTKGADTNVPEVIQEHRY